MIFIFHVLLLITGSTLSPFYMVTTADGYLIMSIKTDNSIAKLKLEDKSTFFHHKGLLPVM